MSPTPASRLTIAGEKLASHVLRRHRLVELFLVEVMGMDWSEVHGEAERLEHAVSERLLERIDTMLGRPEVDPHGDPIPTAGGALATADYADLVTCPVGESLVLVRVTEQAPDFLQLMEPLPARTRRVGGGRSARRARRHGGGPPARRRPHQPRVPRRLQDPGSIVYRRLGDAAIDRF